MNPSMTVTFVAPLTGAVPVVLRIPPRRPPRSVEDVSTYVIQRTGGVTDLVDLGCEATAIRAAAAAMTASGQPVRVLQCAYIAADRTWLCLIEGDEPATAIELLRRAGVSTARVLHATVL